MDAVEKIWQRFQGLPIDERKRYLWALEWNSVWLDMLRAEIPDCPEHGDCIPHAIDWIRGRRLIAPSATYPTFDSTPGTATNIVGIMYEPGTLGEE